MPNDAKSIICEVVHEVCKQIIANPVACPPSPHITLPVSALVENISPIEASTITPGLQSMSLMTTAALSALQALTPAEPSSPPHRPH